MSIFALQRIGSCVRHTWKLFSVALVTYLTSVPPALSQINGKILRTITANGRGIKFFATISLQVNLGVEIQGTTAEDAQKQAAMRSSAVVKYLKNNNVEKLQTTGINLSPVYCHRSSDR